MAEDLILFSHVRWNQQHQRPHQVARELARRGRVFFFEEPMHRASGEPFLETEEVADNLFLCQTYTPEPHSCFHDKQLAYLDPLLAELLERHQIQHWVAWLYTPAAEPLLHDHDPLVTVYDCTAEMQATMHRRNILQQAETDLLNAADLVFTNAPHLHRQLASQHENVHCVIDSIDHAHFSRAAGVLPDSPLQASLPRPRLGFYGTIDERLDTELLDLLAQAHPDWQLVLVGPVIHLEDEQSLPQRPNIHYFGWERYEDLPSFMAGWDLCILPLAEVPSSRYTSPARLLEYLATGRPVISTRVADLDSYFASQVRFTGSREEFAAACEEALQVSARQDQAPPAPGKSWQRTVDHMADLLEQTAARHRRQRSRSGARVVTSEVREISRNAPASAAGTPSVLVLGAGLAGLSAARELDGQALVLEQSSRAGGRCRTLAEKGFLFELSGQVLASRRSDLQELYQQLLGDKVRWQLAENWIYSKSTYTRWPFHESLYGLPADVIQDCLLGMIRPRMAARHQPEPVEAGPPPGGSLESTHPLSSRTIPFRNRRTQPRNLEDYIDEVWGSGIARHFLIPYNQKFWGVPLRELTVEALQGSPRDCDPERVVAGALRPATEPGEDFIGYPRQGGMQTLAEAFQADSRTDLRLNARVVAIHPGERRLLLGDGSWLDYRTLISTLSLPELIRLLGQQVPPDIQEAAAALRYLSLRRVNLGIGRENLSDKHWLYFPEDTLFHRIFLQGNASPSCNAPGGFALTCEIHYSVTQPLPVDGEALIQRCIQDCIRVGLIRAQDPIWSASQVDLPNVQAILNHEHARHLGRIRHWLECRDILLAEPSQQTPAHDAGRAIILGREVAGRLLSQHPELAMTGGV